MYATAGWCIAQLTRATPTYLSHGIISKMTSSSGERCRAELCMAASTSSPQLSPRLRALHALPG